jgi:hypothetical protein
LEGEFDFLSATSRIIFALDAWVTLIIIIKLNVVLLLAKKENTIKEIPTHYFGSS